LVLRRYTTRARRVSSTIDPEALVVSIDPIVSLS
jgi:hypothetical protein